MSRLRRIIVGRASALVSVLVLGFGVLLIVGLGQASHTSKVDDSLPAGTDSTKAAQLREQLPVGGQLDRRRAVHRART